MTRLLLTIFTLLFGFASACTDAAGPADPPDDPGTEDPVLARLQLTAVTTVLDPTATMGIAVAAFDTTGAALPTPSLAWASSDPAVIAVASDGRVTAIAAGAARITAKSGSITGSLDLSVREVAATVARVQIDRDSLVISEGASITLGAIAYDANDNALPGRTITWSSSSPLIVAVSPTGTVTGGEAGTAKLVAHCEGVNAELPVQVNIAVARIEIGTDVLVLQAAQTFQLVATARAANGEILDRDIAWSVVNPAVATISATGFVTAIADGTTTATATFEGVDAQVTIQVRTTDRIELSLTDPTTLDIGEQLLLTARLFDANNQPFVGYVAWSSDHPDIASVDSTGRVTGNAEGGALITASSGNVTASIVVFVATWTERDLVSANGNALPATMYEYTTQVGTATRQLRMQVEGGVLATRALDGRYELMVFGPVFFDDEEGGYATHTSFGTMQWNAATQRFDFLPDDATSAPFDGHYVGNAFALMYRPDPRGAAAALVFGN